MSSSEYLCKENYRTIKKRKWKRKMNKRLAAPVLHASMREFLGQLAKHGMMGRMHDSALCLLSSWAKPCFLGQNCCSMGKTGISRGSFPGQIRDPLIRSGNHSNRFRYRIRRIFPDFFPNPFFPEKMISGREFRYSVSVGTGISRSRFHP